MDNQPSDRELRRALLGVMDSTRYVEPQLVDELLRTGLLTSLSGSPQVTPSGRRFLGPDGPPEDEVKELVLASQHLLHVIPVARTIDLGESGRIVVTSIEVWSHEVVAQWTEICTPEPTEHSPSDPFEYSRLADDVGTSYRCLGGGGGGGPYTRQVHVRFLGTPPTQAGVLHLSPSAEHLDDPLRIDLPV